MLSALGHHQFDVTYRALVMGVVVDPPASSATWPTERDDYLHRAEQLVADGADALDVGWSEVPGGDEGEPERIAAVVGELHERFDVAITVRTDSALVAQAGFEAGAAAAHDPSGLVDPDYLRTAAAAGASIIVSSPAPLLATGADPSGEMCGVLADLARRAEAAGIPSGQILLGPGSLDPTSGPSRAVLDHLDALSVLGWPIVLSVAPDDLASDAQDVVGAALALGIARGARVLRVREVRPARRVAGVMARLLEAHAAERRDVA